MSPKSSLSYQYADQAEVPASSTELSGWSVRKILLAEVNSEIGTSWIECNRKNGEDLIHNNPDWLKRLHSGRKASVRVYLLERDGRIVGTAPFVLDAVKLNCQLADLTLARIPIRMLSLLGYSPGMPKDGAAYSFLFRRLIQDSSEYDAIHCRYLRVNSHLWNFIHDEPLVRRHFAVFSRTGRRPHSIVRFDGSFDNYLGKFSSKSRWHQKRWLKRLEQRGQVELTRISRPTEIDSFFDAAVRISERSWQYNVQGWGVSRRSAELVKQTCRWLAERSWLRCYLLTCGGVPCSFMIGYQYAGRYYNAMPASDVAWNNFSVGNILQLLAIKDMFEIDRPELYDFGTYAPYKVYFSNDSYPEENVILFRKRTYSLMAKWIYQASCAASLKGGLLLDRLKLKPKARRLLRRVSWSSNTTGQSEKFE